LISEETFHRMMCVTGGRGNIIGAKAAKRGTRAALANVLLAQHFLLDYPQKVNDCHARCQHPNRGVA
jgi:hypothetical protein